MAALLSLTPLLLMLLVTVAAAPAAAEPKMSNWKLQATQAGNFDRLARTRRDAVLGPALGGHLFQEETMPPLTLPFAPQAGERDRRGLRFSLHPGHGLKAVARIRF